MILLFLACKAETLGIEVPRGGPESVQMEDLQRDTFLLTQAPDPAGRRAILERRLAEMHTLPAFGRAWQKTDTAGDWICAQKEGRSPRTVYVSVEDAAGPSPAASAAALISLAKAFDTAQPPADALLLCLRPPGDHPPPIPAESLRATYLLGPLGGPSLTIAPAADPAQARRVEAGPAVAQAEDLDFRRLALQVRSLHQDIVGAALPTR